MRLKIYGQSVVVWLSDRDTYDWAHKPGAAWPCSTISDRRVMACFEGNGDLVDIAVDGKSGWGGIDLHEFNAMIEDFLGSDHPAIKYGWEPPKKKKARR